MKGLFLSPAFSDSLKMLHTDILRTVKTRRISQMPELESLLPRALRDTRQEHALVDLQEVVLPLVDNAPGHAAVHAEGEVLHHTQQLHGVVFAVIEDLVAEHRAHGVVSHVVGDSDAAPDHGK